MSEFFLFNFTLFTVLSQICNAVFIPHCEGSRLIAYDSEIKWIPENILTGIVRKETHMRTKTLDDVIQFYNL